MSEKIITPQFTLKLSEGTLKSCKGKDVREVVIPSDKFICNIGRGAFKGCYCLEKVVIPDSVFMLSYRAFGCNISLREIYIPDTVEYIVASAFNTCIRLESVKIPSKIVNIENDVFYNCWSLASVVMSDGVKHIGDRSFYNCKELKDINLSSTLLTIGQDAFNDCESLKSILIPDSVTKIGDQAFMVSGLEEVHIGRGVEDIGYQAFGGTQCVSITVDAKNKQYKTVDDSLLTSDGEVLVQYCNGKQNTSYDVPDGVQSIGAGAFAVNINLESISLPESLLAIGDCAFSSSNIVNVQLPASLEKIYSYAFASCVDLQELVIPSTVNWVGAQAFRDFKPQQRIVISGGKAQTRTWQKGWKKGCKATIVYA